MRRTMFERNFICVILCLLFGPCNLQTTVDEIQNSSTLCETCQSDTPITNDFGSLPEEFRLLFEKLFLDYQPWVCSVIGSILIGLCGILPLLLIPIDAGPSLKNEGGARRLRHLLSFAVGGLLGDVFLHLLPEAWHLVRLSGANFHESHTTLGLWVLTGIFTFIFVEMIFTKEVEVDQNIGDKQTINNNIDPTGVHDSREPQTTQRHLAAGYLNLIANSVDNFAHGLAVAGSFMVSPRMGLLTTAAILLHEVPHELGDFAILLRAGFNRWEAARAQLLTATVGIMGAVTALTAGSSQALGDCTMWILPFTAGGFINISLINVLPDLLKETNTKESITQGACLIAGLATMYFLTVCLE